MSDAFRKSININGTAIGITAKTVNRAFDNVLVARGAVGVGLAVVGWTGD